MRWLLVLFLTVAPGFARASCRLALALGLDVSGSVDAREYRLQMEGLAQALAHPSVRTMLLATPERPVALMVYEWSAADYQAVVADWTLIDSAAALERIVARLDTRVRQAAPYPTSLGQAMRFAARAFDRGPVCAQRTLDLSGDGKSNNWPPPERVRETAAFRDITVNGLVIGSDRPLGGVNSRTEIEDLEAYFKAKVIHGPAAFVERAVGFAGYEAAMVRKLLRELEGAVVGGLPALSVRGG